MVPPLGARGSECAFLPRCDRAGGICRTYPQPALEPIAPDHAVSCWRKAEIAA